MSKFEAGLYANSLHLLENRYKRLLKRAENTRLDFGPNTYQSFQEQIPTIPRAINFHTEHGNDEFRDSYYKMGVWAVQWKVAQDFATHVFRDLIAAAIPLTGQYGVREIPIPIETFYSQNEPQAVTMQNDWKAAYGDSHNDLFENAKMKGREVGSRLTFSFLEKNPKSSQFLPIRRYHYDDIILERRRRFSGTQLESTYSHIFIEDNRAQGNVLAYLPTFDPTVYVGCRYSTQGAFPSMSIFLFPR